MDRYMEDLSQILPAHSMPKIKDKNNNNKKRIFRKAGRKLIKLLWEKFYV